ncbi:penicillin acylase family protein [Glaciecola sp. 33A]|uniref:penicillin acylase family protein n=1 Tax=Glaciecola sp. 33A TaxID=2057807 RepID=UPI000C33044D|nr:penicillin acylase family protein [Glaciecola sp. 33A]PKI02076.1 hypothetical protein CXF81_08745 [Glaciecola sp. 33A]
MNRIFLLMGSAILLQGCPSTQSEQQENRISQVEILRDEYGTPHIYADEVYDLFYGYGYAVAQDRLFQMEMAKRSTQGSVAEVLGAEYLDFDINARTLYSPASIIAQLEKLEQKDREIFEGYASGINAWIAKINQQPKRYMPKQFIDLEFLPSQWDSYDVVMIFVGTMANRFGDFNSEIDNTKILQQLIKQVGEAKGKAIFDDINPRFTFNTSTSISQNDWQASPIVIKKYTEFASRLPASIVESSAESKPISGFSNCYVIGKDKTEGANAILVNGPQFGWFDPAYTYSVGLHGAGFNIVGNTPFAYPVILFGHNADIGWGATWGAGDIVDLYTLELDKKDPSMYQYKGELRSLEKRVENIKVKDGESYKQVIYRSVHGQVVAYDKENLVAVSKKRSWDGSEIKSLLSWLYQGTATTYNEWIDYADDQALNINWYYADRKGNIAYTYTGHYPMRQAGHDNRFPAKGDGSMDWLGIQDFSQNPTALNPEADFIANWNNKPAHGVLNPDLFWYSWSGADRVDILNDTLTKKTKFTPQEAWDLIEKSAYGDVVAKFLLPLIDEAAKQNRTAPIQQLNNWLQSWERRATDINDDGYYDQAQYLFMHQFAVNIIEAVLSDDLGDSFVFFKESGYPTAAKPTSAGMNLSSGLKVSYEALRGKTQVDLLNGETSNVIIQRTLNETLAELTQEYGEDYTQWQLALYPRAFAHTNFMGIPQNYVDTGPLLPIEQNRGTENNMTVFYSERIEAFEVAPPGQSGFIAPDGTKSPHMYDQVDLYQSFGKKRMWFYPEDVERQAQSSESLKVVKPVQF